ncbi:MAG TPA: nickel pincer cofactor biosynthesis protein LarC [Acidimicrobiales bacterium]|nr:nickel pincer cofactor biosynthesis protein LarC [Acidimicrobiales bacterium]
MTEGGTGEVDPTVAWFHCFAGIAGDMALGSLVDAGADAGEVRALLSRLDLPGWDLRFEDALRGGVACTRAIVRGDDVVVRTHGAIASLITAAALPERVARRALAAFGALAAVEASLHRRAIDQVHFHEVGGHDAIVDIVGTAAALEVLGVDDVASSAVATGTGMVRSAHGRLPNPAPATVRLLEGVPSYGRDVGVELTTPTGAALVATLSTSFGPMPPMTITASGFGGGTAELDDLPNCTQVVVGRRSAVDAIGAGQPALVLETNLDDVTGEQLGHALAGALDAGALDAWITAVTMKKGRPGHVLHVLADASTLPALRAEIERVTGTMGVRATALERWPARRELGQVSVDGMTIRMKVTQGRAKPEFDDVAAVAAKTGASLHEVASRAEEAWRAGRAEPEPPAGPEGTPA